MIFGNVRVQDAEGANHAAADIRQERIANVVRLTKRLQDLARIVGNSGGMNTVRTQCLKGQVQLDELITTIRSPVGTAAKDQE
jgi:hypothetical protein